jgi:hypothetical protein
VEGRAQQYIHEKLPYSFVRIRADSLVYRSSIPSFIACNPIVHRRRSRGWRVVVQGFFYRRPREYFRTFLTFSLPSSGHFSTREAGKNNPVDRKTQSIGLEKNPNGLRLVIQL